MAVIYELHFARKVGKYGISVLCGDISHI